MLPVRTRTGKVIREKKFRELLEAGVSLENAKNIVLGKGGRNWADAMSYLTPTIYRGYGTEKNGISEELRKPSEKDPNIKGRVIHLTGSDHDLSKTVKEKSEVEIKNTVEVLKNQNDVEILEDDDGGEFSLDDIVEDLDNFEMDFV